MSPRLIGRASWMLAVAVAGGPANAAAAAPPPAIMPPAMPTLPRPRTIPPRPLPPLGTVATMIIPPRDAAGVRQTVNANLTRAQTTWNFRAALNVAALNCLEPRYQPILGAYKVLLRDHARDLAAVDRALDREFRTTHGASFQAARDRYITRVYNYFALPPTLPEFCKVALVVSGEALTVAPTGLDAFAAEALARFEQVFEGFFRSFEQYQADAAAWDAQYRPALPPLLRMPPPVAAPWLSP